MASLFYFWGLFLYEMGTVLHQLEIGNRHFIT